MKILASVIKNKWYELMVITYLTGTHCFVSGTARDRGRRILTPGKSAGDRNCQAGSDPSSILSSILPCVWCSGGGVGPQPWGDLTPLPTSHWLKVEGDLISKSTVSMSFHWGHWSGFLMAFNATLRIFACGKRDGIWYPMGLLVVGWHLLL